MVTDTETEAQVTTKHRIRIAASTLLYDAATGALIEERAGSATEIDTLDAEQQELRMSALTTIVGNPAVVHDALGMLRQTATHLELAELPADADDAAKVARKEERDALAVATDRAKGALEDVLKGTAAGRGAIGREPLGTPAEVGR
jgi:hypothetical protein